MDVLCIVLHLAVLIVSCYFYFRLFLFQGDLYCVIFIPDIKSDHIIIVPNCDTPDTLNHILLFEGNIKQICLIIN